MVDNLREQYIYLSYWLDPFFLIYFGMINLFYTILLMFGSIKIFKRYRELQAEDFTYLLKSASLPPITFIVPAYNEEDSIRSVAENLVNLSYRNKQVIIINDGSTDATMSILMERFKLVSIPKSYRDKLLTKPLKGIYRSTTNPELIFIDKYNGMKEDAVDAGLNACKTKYFILVDADTYVDDTSFEAIIRPILSSPLTMGVGATVRIRNGVTLRYNKIDTSTMPLNFVIGMQTLEYLRGFIMRQGWDYIGGHFIISGAFSVYVTDFVLDIGGYGPTVANDLEIILRINRALLATGTKYEIFYLPDPAAWTDVPDTIKSLGKQRVLWQRGTCESIWYNICMLFNPRYGRYGFIVFPFLVFFEALEPIIEVMGIIYIIVGILVGVVHIVFISLLLATVWGFIAVYTLACLIIEELSFKSYTAPKTLGKLVFYTLTEFFTYRMLTLYWRIKGTIDFLSRYELNDKYASVISKYMQKYFLRRGILDD